MSGVLHESWKFKTPMWNSPSNFWNYFHSSQTQPQSNKASTTRETPAASRLLYSPALMSFFTSMLFTRFKSLPHIFVESARSRLVRRSPWMVTRFDVFRVVVAVSSVDGVVTAVKFVLLFRLLKHLVISLLSLPLTPPPLQPPLDVAFGIVRVILFSPATLCISFTTSILVTTERAWSLFCCWCCWRCRVWQPSEGVPMGEFIIVDCDDMTPETKWKEQNRKGMSTLKFLLFLFVNLILQCEQWLFYHVERFNITQERQVWPRVWCETERSPDMSVENVQTFAYFHHFS